MGVYRSCLPRRSGGHQGCSPPNIHPPRPARRGGSRAGAAAHKAGSQRGRFARQDARGDARRRRQGHPARAPAGAAPSARGGRHRPGPHLSHGGTRAAPRGAACDVAAAAAALLAPPAAGESPAGIKLGLRGCFVRTRSSPPLRVALNGAVQRGSFSLLRLQLAADAIVVCKTEGEGGPVRQLRLGGALGRAPPGAAAGARGQRAAPRRGEELALGRHRDLLTVDHPGPGPRTGSTRTIQNFPPTPARLPWEHPS